MRKKSLLKSRQSCRRIRFLSGSKKSVTNNFAFCTFANASNTIQAQLSIGREASKPSVKRAAELVRRRNKRSCLRAGWRENVHKKSLLKSRQSCRRIRFLSGSKKTQRITLHFVLLQMQAIPFKRNFRLVGTRASRPKEKPIRFNASAI